MLKSDIGILSAGTGFGKTVTAAALIAERKTNTMILVQTHTLLEQWKKAVKRFLNYEAGTIAAGKDTATVGKRLSLCSAGRSSMRRLQNR